MRAFARLNDWLAQASALLIELGDVLCDLGDYDKATSTYARALAKFGEAGIVEATSLEGYYTLLAMVMNTARTPLPAGAKPPLAALPR